MWNAHHTVFGSKRSAVCAQAVYFLHSTRSSVTWLNSRWSLAGCDWVMSALSAVLSIRVGCRRKFEEASYMECTCQGNYIKLIQTVEMETRHPVEGYFGNEFPAICNHCGVMAAWSRKTLKILTKSCVAYLTNIFAWLFICRYCADRAKICQGHPRQCTQGVPDSTQIGSLSAEL